MNLPRKKIRTSLGVLSEVDNNINALTTLPWGKNKSGEEQHGHARWLILDTLCIIAFRRIGYPRVGNLRISVAEIRRGWRSKDFAGHFNTCYNTSIWHVFTGEEVGISEIYL